MAKEKPFSPERYSIVIPYKDFVTFTELAAKLEDMEHQMKRIEERSAAMQHMYSELLEKIAEINRYL